ncbi:ethionine resistance protein [Coemansia sp. RSA 1813]|nr:ethionine resistance protein [Coemansia sp. RSA 1843]KAJ2215395.1 ethionine resistance protein [Coemansia sp. RSA 487]KAJ2569984.1 ethionine resistance protein [Coemansia sp. RSA 1813]
MSVSDISHFVGSVASGNSSPSTPLLSTLHVAEEEADRETADYSSTHDQNFQRSRYSSSFSSDADARDLASTHDLLDIHNIKAEAARLLLSALPIVVSTMSQLLLMVPMMAAVGRLGTIALASMNLVSIYAGLGGVAPLSGMAMALDSLCSQAFTAAKDKRLLGIYLQRVLLLCVCIQIAIYPLWWNAAPIYRFLGIPDDIAQTTGSMLRLYFIGIALVYIYECLKSFLFAQGIRRFAVLAQLVCLPAGWLTIWVLLVNESTAIGILGVPCVVIVVGACFNIFALVYISRVDGYQCWGGWSRSAFSHLKPVVKLALSGSAISFFETVALHMIDLGVLFLDAQSMAAQAILSVIVGSTWGMGMGFAIAACNRVGNLLGAGMLHRAQLAVYTSIGIAMVAFMALGCFLLAKRRSIPGLFTDDPKVADILVMHIPWAAVSGTVQGINMALNGILRSQGRQSLIARIRVASFTIIAVPLSSVAVAVFHWRLAGLWFGYLVSLITTLSAQLYYVFTTNWQLEVERCRNNISKALLHASLENEETDNETEGSSDNITNREVPIL